MVIDTHTQTLLFLPKPVNLYRFMLYLPAQSNSEGWFLVSEGVASGVSRVQSELVSG